MSEDFLYQARQVNPEAEFDDFIYSRALTVLEDHILSSGGKSLDEYGFPPFERVNNTGMDEEVPREVLQETSYDQASLQATIDQRTPNLTEDQRHAVETVLTSVRGEGTEHFFFLDSPGGTGKTYTTNLLLAKVRIGGGVAIAVASSGIAATFLHNGRTAHARFKIPLDLGAITDPSCNIDLSSGLADLLRSTQLIVWDEISMAHKGGLEALNKSLKEIRRSDKLFGGMTMLLSGDMRQILPVVPRGTPADELDAC